MTDLTITEVRDTWVNAETSRRGTNYIGAERLRLESGLKRIFLKLALQNISGRTVLDAYLVGRSAGTSAQTLTVAPVADRWTVGRVTGGNQPAIGPGAVSAAVPAAADKATVTVAGLAAILQAHADGTPWHGLRVSTSATTEQVFYSVDSGEPAWQLYVVLSDLTDAPTDLRPNNGAVPTNRPRLAWTAEGQVSLRVQADKPATGAAPDGVSPDFDSGTVASVVPEFDLAGSAFNPTGSGPFYWRVQVVASGDQSPAVWSDWASYTVAAMPSLIIDSPTGPFGDPSPRLLAHLSSGVLSSWRVLVTGPDRADVRWETGLMTGPIDVTVPRKSKGRRVVESGGWAYFEAFDSVERAVAVGSPGHVSAWVQLTLSDSGTVTAPTMLDVSQVADGDPRNSWRWRRTEPADAYLIGQGDQDVRRVEASEVTVNAGWYEFTDDGELQPLRPQTRWVKAIEGDKSSLPSTIEDRVHTVEGVWIVPDDGDPIQVDGVEVGGFVNSGRYATYSPLVGPSVDVIYDANPGRTGQFVGSVQDRPDQDVWDALDAIEVLRGSRTRLARLVWGSQSLRVRIVDPDSTSADVILPDTLTHVVRFAFVQVGD